MLKFLWQILLFSYGNVSPGGRRCIKECYVDLSHLLGLIGRGKCDLCWGAGERGVRKVYMYDLIQYIEECTFKLTDMYQNFFHFISINIWYMCIEICTCRHKFKNIIYRERERHSYSSEGWPVGDSPFFTPCFCCVCRRLQAYLTAPEKMQHLEVHLKSPTQTYVSF